MTEDLTFSPASGTDRHAIGIIGTGAFASVHAAALTGHPRLRLAGISGTAPGAADDISARFGVRSFRDTNDLVEHPGIDAVIVATPHASHAALARTALLADVHVLIEKPVTISAREAVELIELAAASPARAMVGHLMRWAPAHIQARELIEEGAIGEIVAAESRRIIPWMAEQRRDWHKEASAGGGMWLVQGVHVLDQLRWLIGWHADAVIGTAATAFHPTQTADDFGTALLDYQGVRASVTIAGLAQGPNQVYSDIYGTRGVLRVSHRGLLQIDAGNGWIDRLAPVDDHWQMTLRGELDEFANMIRGARASTDLEYGRRIVATVDGIRRSQESRRWEQIA